MNASEKIWSSLLNQLAAQVTRATMNTWVYTCRVGEWDPNRQEITIIAPNAPTCEWLQDRLLNTMRQQLVGITGKQTQIRIVIDNSPKHELPDELPDRPNNWLKFYEFDPMKRGFLQVPKYVERYWQPYLGPVAYATYRFLRTLDRQNDGWGPWRKVSISRIADTVARGNRQAISGVQRRQANDTPYHQPGALDRLSEAGIVRIKKVGKTRARCHISCLNSLPLLTPVQVAELSDLLQWYHSEELKEARLEQEEWEQIKPDSLVQE